MGELRRRRKEGEWPEVVRVIAGGGREIIYDGAAADWWVHFALAGVTRLRVISWLCMHPGEHTCAVIEAALGLTQSASRNGLVAMQACGLVAGRVVSLEKVSAWRWSVTEEGRKYLWRYGWVTGRLAPGSWADDTFDGRTDAPPWDVLARYAVPSLLRPLAMATAYALWQLSPVSLEYLGHVVGKPSCYVRYFVTGWQRRGWVLREPAPQGNYRVTRRRPRWRWKFTRAGLEAMERHIQALRWAAQNSGYDVPSDDRFLMEQDKVNWYSIEIG